MRLNIASNLYVILIIVNRVLGAMQVTEIYTSLYDVAGHIMYSLFYV